MNRFVILMFSLLLTVVGVQAQPSQVKNAAKSMFRLTAYDSAGNPTSNTCGVFVSNNGEAIGAWSALANASRAEVTDANGKTYAVRSIIGASELYDVCRFRVEAAKTPAAVLAKSIAAKGAKLWLVQSFEGKKVSAAQFEVEREENFMEKYGYYIFAYNDKGGDAGSLFVNANGEVVGMLQISETSLDTHAVDANYAASLTFNAFDVNNPTYSKSGIRMQLPNDRKQAQLMMMLSVEQNDSAKYAGYISDYISLFPQAVDGYSTSAMRKSGYGDYAGADADMQMALKKSENKAEAHAEYSRVMYHKLLYSNDSLFTSWTLDKALQHAEEAYKLDPQPAYLHRKAQILYSKKDFAKAYDMFLSLATSSMSNSEVFFEAAQCKTQMGAKNEEIIALLDSAVAHCERPYNRAAAPYILTRGQMRDAMKDYRGALADYNTYDTIMVGRASADFYFTRYQCEMNMRQYQPALNDIAHAAYVAPANMQPIYLAELASLQLRVNKLEEAVRTADICLQITPESTDALVIKGVALNGLKKKKEALECLQRAKELGDPRGEEFIKKYSK